MSDSLDLWDYRRRVHDLYHRVRTGGWTEDTWTGWARDRDYLFANHPQSPIEDRSTFAGLAYLPYDSNWHVRARFNAVEDETAILAHSGEGATRFLKIGSVTFEVAGNTASLDVLWLDAYGGGLFLPFRDGTNGHLTYGGGRYLLDTVKGADLGSDGDEIVLDFNYSYHPSCVHSYRWSCPLAPRSNTLTFAVEAGERLSPP